jgi:heme oxygenase
LPSLVDPADLNLLTVLRGQTRDAHARLDAAVDFRVRGSVTRARYAAFLHATASVVMTLEPMLAGWLPSLGNARRTESLRSDLAALGERCPESALLAAPCSLAEAYGCAYVVEGSSLGGLVLASMIARDLGERAPIAYLTLRGTGTKAAWQSFLRELASFGARSDARDHDAAARMAVRTFDAYTASLARHGLLREIA